MRRRSWTVQQLKNAVKKSRSIRQVLLCLNLKPAGGNYTQIQKYIDEYGLGADHFKGRGWSIGLHLPPRPKIPLEKILVKNSFFQSFKLKNRLFTAGLKPLHCEDCGWNRRTSAGYLPLELDHINGNPRDNRLINLRVLCPNCHSLRPNHRGRKVKGKKQLMRKFKV